MKKISLRIVMVCLIVFFLKNEFTSFLLLNATYGMPALIKKGEIESLYIGSSMFRQGLDIYALENDCADSYILAYNGNQPTLELEQLEYLLQKGVDIENLYIDMYVYSAWSETKLQDEKLLMEIDLNEKKEIWKLIAKSDSSKILDFWRMFVASNNELLLTWPINNFLINSQFYKGGAKIQNIGSNKSDLMKLTVPVANGDMNPKQKKSIDDIIQLCEINEINLCFIETPKYHQVAEDKSYLIAMQEYTEFVSEKEIPIILCLNTYENIKKYGNVYYYDFDNDCAEYFTDLIHLSYSGRVEFTKELGSILKR